MQYRWPVQATAGPRHPSDPRFFVQRGFIHRHTSTLYRMLTGKAGKLAGKLGYRVPLR